MEAALDEPVVELWHRREAQHIRDSYCGVRLQKLPEDLRAYEHLIWAVRPDCVIELGTGHGGSALWFRDRLLALARYGRIASEPRVVSVDVDQAPARWSLEVADPRFGDHITLIAADVRDPGVAEAVAAALPADARCLVVEDSLHSRDTTAAALRACARFVPVGGYFVVEDGIVDDPRRRPGWYPHTGVVAAVEEWLASGEGTDFVQCRAFELYGFTNHPGGFLRRVRRSGR